MKTKHLETIINEVADCERLAETQEEFAILHSIYLDAQHLHKKQTGKYYPRREYPNMKSEREIGGEE